MATVPLSSPAPKPDLSISKFFAKLQDPRRAHRRLHRLQDILVIALCAVIAGAQDWQQVETFGRNAADGAGRTASRGILFLQPAPLLNFIVRRHRTGSSRLGG